MSGVAGAASALSAGWSRVFPSTWSRRGLVLVLLLGCALRLTGVGRGVVEAGAGAPAGFDGFHPDEATLARAALALHDPLDPPLTAYGLFPLYLARAALAAAGAGTAADPDAGDREVYLVLRALAVLIGCGTLVLAYLLGRRVFDEAAAVLAALFLAVAPVAIQQAHFYTVDGVFLLCVAVALWAMVRFDEAPSAAQGALVGALAGLAAATRLTGLLLLPVAVAAVRRGGGLRALLRHGVVVLAAALAVLFLLEPYLLVHPARLARDLSSDDFLFSARIASGERLRSWTLYDVHTRPWLHYWTDLFPLGVGWPLTAAFAAATAWAARSWDSRRGTLLLWCGLDYVAMGGLHTKHVRYLAPLLPGLVPLAAGLGVALWRTAVWRAAVWRVPPRLPRAAARACVAGVTALSVAYGCAFSRIYAATDSRIAAAEWLGRNVPSGSTVGLETGGFSMRGLVDAGRYDIRPVDVGPLFHLRGYLSCSAEAEHLAQGAAAMDYLVVVDENRSAQVAAAPEILPATASFYRALAGGDLGFRQAFSARVEPSLFGLRFGAAGGDPSFYGFDHPGVRVYARGAQTAAALARWRQTASADRACPDSLFARAVARAGAGDAAGALAVTAQISGRGASAAQLLVADLHRLQGDAEGDAAAVRRFEDGYFGAEQAHLIPWATSLTLAEAGAPDLALTSLMMGALHARAHPTPEAIRTEMADSYRRAAHHLGERGGEGFAAIARRLAAEVGGSGDAAPPRGNAGQPERGTR